MNLNQKKCKFLYDQDISRLGVFIGCLVESLTALLGSPTAPPRHKVLLVLDEIANLGYLPELERAVSYLQGSGTQVLMAFQNIKQAARTFGEDSPILASIGTQVHYRPHDTSTAEWIAGYLGLSTVQTTSVTAGGAHRGTKTVSEHVRPLLTADEVLRIGNNDAIVLHQGTAPIRATKLGAPLPSTRPEQVQAWLWHWRWAVGAVGIAVLLALALWPVTRLERTARPSTGSSATTVSSRQPVPPPPGGPWLLTSRQGTQPLQPGGRYPELMQCQAAMADHYSGLLAMAEALQTEGKAQVQVERQPAVWRWRVAYPRVRPVQYEVACREQPE